MTTAAMTSHNRWTDGLREGCVHKWVIGSGCDRARGYDVNTGRWLSEDPIGYRGDASNLYRYVGNSPTNAVDPFGLYEMDFHFYVIYYLLRTRGWSDTEAGIVANFSQYVDDSNFTDPVKNFSDTESNAAFHFPGAHNGSGVSKNAFVPQFIVRRYFEFNEDTPGDLSNEIMLGIGLHAYADSWSHEMFIPGWGPFTNQEAARERGDFFEHIWPSYGHGDTSEY